MPTDLGVSVSSCNGDDNESSCIEVNVTGGALDVDTRYVCLLKKVSPWDRCGEGVNNSVLPVGLSVSQKRDE